MSSATGDLNETQLSTSFSSTESSKSCRHFEFPEILLATNNFDESLVIGHGGFGKLYKGNIINGSIVSVAAFKRLDSMSSQGATEFWAEVEMLSNLRHCRLVSLFGYCSHENEMILVYEYMPNGTLEDHLHSLGTPLSWLQRLKICISAARGLDYLHTGTGIDVGVIHRDVKSSNILLHESWAAKISDFGLSKIGPTNQPLTHVHTLVRGTFGYLDPDYSFTGRLTRKSDVYAFGVVLLEVLCRKRAVDESLGEEQWNLARWVQESIKEGNLKHIIDNGIRGEISPKCLKEFVRIAERCLLSNPKRRPMMAEVVVRLNYVLTLQEKLNISLQATDKTIFGKLLDMFPFASNGENSGSCNIKDTSRRNADDTLPVDNKDSVRTVPKLEVYKFDDLEVATQNFSFLCLGSRDLFIGWVDRNTFTPSLWGMGIEVAVKWYSELQPKCQYQRVVNALGRLSHPNIIRLLGYSIDKQPRCLLVYEYMQQQNFGHFLFGEDLGRPLSWERRILIIIGVVRGLAYMHSSINEVIHCDVKSSNIFLDKDFNAKLGGFGRALVGRDIGNPHVAGTFGYLDPTYIFTHCFTARSDIYSFGVVMLETLTGQRAYDMKRLNHDRYLTKWASPFFADTIKLKKIMDPRLEQNYSLEGAFECAKLAARCVTENPKDRPSSEEVLRGLEQIYAATK
ncbi:hypothetical protein Lser_V15G33719 [Lactuca serriola]